MQFSRTVVEAGRHEWEGGGQEVGILSVLHTHAVAVVELREVVVLWRAEQLASLWVVGVVDGSTVKGYCDLHRHGMFGPGLGS